MDFESLAQKIRGFKTTRQPCARVQMKVIDARRTAGPSAEELRLNTERERALRDLADACQWDVDFPDHAAHNARKQYAILQAQCEQEFYRFYSRSIYGEKSLPADS